MGDDRSNSQRVWKGLKRKEFLSSDTGRLLRSPGVNNSPAPKESIVIWGIKSKGEINPSISSGDRGSQFDEVREDRMHFGKIVIKKWLCFLNFGV